MKISSKLILIFFFLSTFNSVVLSQKDKDINVKTTAIKSGILIPVGELAKSNSVGFIVADLTKWSLSKYVKVLGRLEAAVYGGKKIENKIIVGYDYQTNTPIYMDISETTNPIGILTAGSGFEFTSGSKDGGFFASVDFPSINMIISKYGELRAGLGAGLGYEFTWGQSLLGFEFKGTAYNVFLSESGEKILMGIQVGFEAAF